jgi:hypothetical protein
MWSIIYKRCETCPASTYALAGDISCTRCSTNTFSIEGLPVCFPNNFVGAVMKLDQPFGNSNDEQFQRAISSILNITTNDVFIIASRPGSTIYYFYLNVIGLKLPAISSLLSGNELMLQLYEYYQTLDPIITNSNLPPILSFNLLTVESVEAELPQSSVVNSISQPQAIVPPQPQPIEEQFAYYIPSTGSSFNNHLMMNNWLFYVVLSSLLLLIIHQ